MEVDRITAEDERRHAPGAGPSWEESWYLDFVDGAGALAGYVRLTLRPAERTAWYWVGMVGGGPALVTLRDHEVPPPAGRGLEVRASGLWTELVCETPLDHWSVGLEAFGVALDDPLEAWGQERGDPWALGLDVEWEAASPCAPWPGAGTGYSQPCTVHGDVLVGADRFALDGTGTRVHLWGDQPRRSPTGWAGGRLDGAAAFLTVGPAVECHEDGRLRSATIEAAGTVVTATAVAHAPVLVPGAGRLARALCRYEAGDGPQGHGWAEWFHPATGSAPA
jgi:hypothetical protein